MDARSVAFMGSRLFAIIVLLFAVSQIPILVGLHAMWKVTGDENPIFQNNPIIANYLSIAAWLLTAYVMWVHAGWMSKLLTDGSSAPNVNSGSYGPLVYRGIGLFAIVTNLPLAIFAYTRSTQDVPNPAAALEFKVHLLMIGVAIVLMIGADRFRSFIAAAGPGPGAP